MSDFLTNLSQRVLGTAPLVRPGSPSLFAPQRVEVGEFGSATAWSVDVPAENPGPAAPVRETAREHTADGGLHPFPSADNPEAPAGVSEPDPVPTLERLHARRTLLPPVPDSEREELPRSPQVSSDNPFVASGEDPGRTPSEERSMADAIPSRDSHILPVGERPDRLKRPVEEGRKIVGTGEWSEEGNIRRIGEVSDRLIARTIERTISGKGERQMEGVSPRRLVSAERMSEGRSERIEDVGLAPPSLFTEEGMSPIADPERVSAPGPLSDIAFNGERQENRRAERFRGTLLVPNHVPHGEGQTVAEEMRVPSAPAERGERRGDEAVSSRTINVTIGRIEVRGTPERKAPPTPARKPAKKGAEPAPVMSLSDYLKRYNGSGG